MRVLVGSENSGDLRQSELRRHLQMMSRCVEAAKTGSSLTMILRSAASDPAKALIGMKGALQRVGARAKVILARIDPEDDLRQLFTCLSELAPQQPAQELIRWARNPRLLDAHEQVIYGDALCWSGDAMRRDADKRNALAMFEEDAPEPVRFGRLAFAAMWAQSTPVPERRLIGPASVRPSGAYEQAPDPEVDMPALRPSLQGWPLLRH
jgi:hypothetical protein